MAETIASIIVRLQSGLECRVLGLGDSLTYGWQVQRGFFDRFVDGLVGRFPEAEIERVNAGIPGDTTAGALSRVGPLASKDPHLALVQFGINDCFTGVPVDSYAHSLARIATRLSESGAAVLLCTSCSVAHLDDALAIEPFYDAVARVGSELGLEVAALHEYWDDNAGVDESLFGWDGIHPNDSGHEIMAAGLLTFFEVGQSRREAS